jgi:hypothetical protein
MTGVLGSFLIFGAVACKEREGGLQAPVAPSALPLPNAPPGAVGAYTKRGLTPTSEGSDTEGGDAGIPLRGEALGTPDGGVHL